MASILVSNISFQNRGDALMVRALRERLGSSHDWSVSASVAVRSRADCRQMSICLSSDLAGETIKQRVFNAGVGLAALIAKAFPASWRRKTRFRLLEDIDVAFDLSGYQFSDFWGQAKIDQATRNYARLKEAGARVILMPRTWGPFDTIGPQILERMFERVDLAFARDAASLAAITEKISEAQQAKLHFAPDYTHGVEPRSETKISAEHPVSWVVPSHNVLTSKTLGREDYFRLLGIARTMLAEAGLNPRLLIHETSNDLKFVDDAGEMGFAAEDVVVAGSAIEGKELIAAASAVVSSRLHATYNALNNCVPVAVIPWSFKYGEALSHYGCADCLVDMTRPENSLREKIRLITDPISVADLKERMRAGKADQVAKTEAMWTRITEVTGLERHG